MSCPCVTATAQRMRGSLPYPVGQRRAGSVDEHCLFRREPLGSLHGEDLSSAGRQCSPLHQGNNLADIDSLDLSRLNTSELLFGTPGYTLGLNEIRSLPLYTVTGTTYSAVTAGVVLSSSDTNVAMIQAGNQVKAAGAGSATITAAYNGRTATVAVNVKADPRTVQSLALTGPEAVLNSGQTSSPLRATAHYNNYEVQDVTGSAQYTSSNPGVAAIDPATHTVSAVQPGTALITASYGGKQATYRVTVIAASDAVQVTTTLKTPSGVVPALPGVVNAVYHNQPVQAEVVGGELAGLDFSTIGTVQVPVTLKMGGQEFSSTISAEVVPGYGLDELVNQLRSKLDNFSYPLGSGAGNYSAAKYADFVAAVDHAEGLAGNAELTQAQFIAELNALAEAEAALLNSLNTTQNGITYKAYRDFSGDTAGKYPYGITTQDLTNGATAVVREEGGNKFLRLTTTAVAGKANLFLPYAGEVNAEGISALSSNTVSG